MDKKPEECLICGAPLIYYDVPKEMACSICHKTFENNVACEKDHYICDDCHSKEGIEAIKNYCLHGKGKDPVEIMLSLMETPSIYMHGPEHHVLVGAALITAYANCGGNIQKEAALEEMIRRGSQIPGGVCGFWGSCGAAISSGMFMSIITGATPLTKESWSLANRMTAESLYAISELGGPRCCKRNSYTAVLTAVEFTKNHLGVEMELPDDVICTYTASNAQCTKWECPYFIGNHQQEYGEAL